MQWYICAHYFRAGVVSDLYARVAVVGGDDPVLGEDKVERAAGLPPLEFHRYRGVGLCVPLSDLLEPVHHVSRGKLTMSRKQLRNI